MASNDFRRKMDAAFVQTLATLGAHQSQPGSWFDGFWDFVVQNRDKIERSAGWQMSGLERYNWAILCLAPPRTDAEDRLLEIHVFVEARDYRPGVLAPWPVSSIVIGSREPAQEGRPDPLNRPHDAKSADVIRQHGYEVAVGYWGAHIFTTLRQKDESLLIERAEMMLSKIDAVVRLALDLFK